MNCDCIEVLPTKAILSQCHEDAMPTLRRDSTSGIFHAAPLRKRLPVRGEDVSVCLKATAAVACLAPRLHRLRSKISYGDSVRSTKAVGRGDVPELTYANAGELG